MKNILIILIAFATVANASGQKDSTEKIKTNVGFMFNPQGGIALDKASDLFKTYLPLYIMMPVSKGNFGITPIYSLSNNSFGGFVSYSSSPKYGEYVVALKSKDSQDFYLGTGFGKSVNNGNAGVFLEFGSLTNRWNPFIFSGFSLKFLLKQK